MTYYRPTTITIDLSLIAHNIRLLQKAIGPDAALMAVVKANAYGHGLIPTALAAVSAGASWLGVALTEEGECLRDAGITVPILVLGGTTANGAFAAVKKMLTQTVFDPEGVSRLQTACEALDKTVDVHIKIDTGMGRVGVRNAAELEQVLLMLAKSNRVRLTGAFTHYANADSENTEYTYRQLDLFHQFTRKLPGGLTLHSANSAAAMNCPETRLNLVRTGIAVYGCPPVKTDLPFKPAKRLVTHIAFVKDIAAGDCIGYGCMFTANQPMRVATLPVGYGDGYHRAGSGKAKVLIGNTVCRVLGRICMDQMMVDVSHLSDARSGDEVVLMGAQGDACITADMIGNWCGTIAYEILLSATSRVPVEYINER